MNFTNWFYVIVNILLIIGGAQLFIMACGYDLVGSIIGHNIVSRILYFIIGICAMIHLKCLCTKRFCLGDYVCCDRHHDEKR